MNITDSAKQKLEVIFQEKSTDSIRFYSVGGGCCGPQVGLSLDRPNEADVIQEINGIKVAIEQEVKGTVAELTLDNEETPEGARFVFIGMNQCC
ncbi:HesB/IscA family protein [Oceanobacillus salinisoli]|uniref:HesB/IscA family protein n=1 Tax=Oceanobacillus salinisoli TaxID=2678611 RepID=UPI0012E26E26|nr:adhesin [Oceanobacillus salinisoli]